VGRGGPHGDLLCDPKGRLWETSLRLRTIDDHPAVKRAVGEGRLLVIHPDHDVEAGFLCFEPEKTMRTFRRGQEQGERLLASDRCDASWRERASERGSLTCHLGRPVA